MNVELPEGYKLFSYETIDSTNEEIKRLAGKGEGCGTMVSAKTQLDGRGRFDRTWISPPGNLYLSLLKEVDFDKSIAHQISFISALAVREIISDNSNVKYKWPNDILLGSKKLAGILLESFKQNDKDFLIVGVGVNVRSYPEDTDFPATCLSFENIKVERLDLMIEKFLASFNNWLDIWKNEGFEKISEAWLGNVTCLNEEIEVRSPTESIKGIFKGVDKNGSLILDKDGSTVSINAGDVFFSSS